MTASEPRPEYHYAEAERLLRVARQSILTGAPIGFNTHAEVAHLAQVHATLALYRAPAVTTDDGPHHVEDYDGVGRACSDPYCDCEEHR